MSALEAPTPKACTPVSRLELPCVGGVSQQTRESAKCRCWDTSLTTDTQRRCAKMQELVKAEVEQVLRRTQPCWNGAPQMKRTNAPFRPGTELAGTAFFRRIWNLLPGATYSSSGTRRLWRSLVLQVVTESQMQSHLMRRSTWWPARRDHDGFMRGVVTSVILGVAAWRMIILCVLLVIR